MQNAKQLTANGLQLTAYSSRLSAVGCLLLAVGSLLSALEFPNPAMVTGTYAVGTNPAQLASGQRPRFAYQLLQLRVGADNNSLNAFQYNRYTGAFLDSTAKLDIMGSVPKTGLRLDGDADLDGLAFTTGMFGLAVRGHAAASGTIPKDVIDLVLSGNELDRRYSVSTLQGEAIAYSDVTLGFGVPLARGLTTGIGLKYLRGIFVAQNTDVDGYLLTTPYVVNSEVLAGYRWALGGNGYGLDWGMTYEWGSGDRGQGSGVQGFDFTNRQSFAASSHLRVALAVTNLNLGINWTTQPGAAVFRFNLDSVNLVRLTSTHGAASTEFTQSHPAGFKTQLPCFLNVGAALEPVRGLTVGLSVLEGFRNSALSSVVPEATVAAEYRGLRWLPLSIAASAGGRDGFALEAGLGFQVRGFGFGVRVANRGGVALSARGLSAGISLCYQTPAPGYDRDPGAMRLHYDRFDGSKE
jgi:hypothetical protein